MRFLTIKVDGSNILLPLFVAKLTNVPVSRGDSAYYELHYGALKKRSTFLKYRYNLRIEFPETFGLESYLSALENIAAAASNANRSVVFPYTGNEYLFLDADPSFKTNGANMVLKEHNFDLSIERMVGRATYVVELESSGLFNQPMRFNVLW